MSVPDVTVIVPVYNTMPYLVACLDSLVAQTIGPGLEVVAVDDGSTDGSGQTLDDYAARHPDLFTVIHQPNSGGAAQPCNRGLDAARGRFVLFVGADDYLGAEALERMVGKADEWESDVVAGRMVGVGGRWVNQRLYAETRRDVPFPSELVASALSNTKLFRRSVLETHGVRFPEDLQVGSDQPFTIEAMLHARRISVLADYDYYFAVKRKELSNLTYTSTWRARLGAMTEIMRHIADLVPAGEGRDDLLTRHLSGEVATLLRLDFGELPEPEQKELVDAVNALTADYLTARILGRLRVLARLRYALAADGDLDALRSLAGAEDRAAPVVVEGGRTLLAYDGFRTRYDDEMYLDEGDSLRAPQIAAAFHDVTVSLDGSVLVVSAATQIAGAPTRVVLMPAPEGSGRKPARHQPGSTRPTLVADAAVSAGRLEGRLDLSPLPGVGGEGPWAARIQVDAASYTFSLPVQPVGTATWSSRAVGGSVRTRTDDEGRLLVEADRAGARGALLWQRLVGRLTARRRNPR